LIIEQNYLRKVPRNPFNGLETLHIIGNAEGFPAEATGNYGWIYQPATRNIRLDRPGNDSGGAPYLSY